LPADYNHFDEVVEAVGRIEAWNLIVWDLMHERENGDIFSASESTASNSHFFCFLHH
jgi:hypothetical protein